MSNDKLKEELDKCKKSPYYFFMNYCTINGKPAKTSLSEEDFNKLWGAAAAHTKLPENKSRSKNEENVTEEFPDQEMAIVLFGTIDFSDPNRAVITHLEDHSYVPIFLLESEAEELAEKKNLDYVIPSKFKGEIIFENL